MLEIVIEQSDFPVCINSAVLDSSGPTPRIHQGPALIDETERMGARLYTIGTGHRSTDPAVRAAALSSDLKDQIEAREQEAAVSTRFMLMRRRSNALGRRGVPAAGHGSDGRL